MYNLHKLGWNSFQQLCLTIAREVLGQTVQSFLDSNDAGQDGAFSGNWNPVEGQNLSGKFVIQCKFTNRVDHRYTPSDIKEEIPKIEKLVNDGFCDVYILMTNAGISGKQTNTISLMIKDAGVKDVLIFGSTWIEDQIKEKTKLRMLVPRLYGLGDLSQILDERAYAQARAVLDSLREDLAKVVITSAYRKAIKALDEHGFVLLIGEPAAGKTTIASMLAMAAADKWGSSVVKLADPAHVVERWNSNESSQFFWVDDAFGVTQYESSLVYGWNHSLVQIRAMLHRGVKIVMTSRDYIYNRARNDLKESAFPLLSESQVVIDVHELSNLEKQQILYNHLKLGQQPVVFRSKIKQYLEDIAAHSRFIPETARRIADPFFTKDIYFSKYHFEQFVDKREKFLQEIITGLDANSKAALGMIYMRKDHLESPITLQGNEAQALDRLGSTLGECISALNALNGSLVTLVNVDDMLVWRFKHPTIGDAYAMTLASSPDLLGVFLNGSSIENLMQQVTCGNVGLEKAVIVPKSLFPMMVARLSEFSASDRYKVQWMSVWGAKRALYLFLAYRCSKEFLELYIEATPEILSRICEPGLRLDVVPEVRLVVSLYKNKLLPEENRKRFVETVSRYAIDGEDIYALRNEQVRCVFTESEYEELVNSVRTELIPVLSIIRENSQSNYTKSEYPDEYMQDTIEFFDTLKEQFSDDSIAIDIIESELKIVNKWIAEADTPEPEISPRKLDALGGVDEKNSIRSIFDDIDSD
jgi:energy-coupling factor transporter ATP-binding protein EcfA2